MPSAQSLSVRVPGSSANVGPGFDVLGMALDVHAEIGITDESKSRSDSSQSIVEGRHPALVAYRSAGGTGELWVRSSIPSGRGLGFSGAMRVGGVALGMAENDGVTTGELQSFIAGNRREILNRAADLEGHADNAAASLMGGVVACVDVDGGFTATAVPLAARFVSEVNIIVWIPHVQTATAESRAALPASVSRADAVFNLSRLAQLILAMGSGSESGFSLGVQDRLHQDHRLERVPMSRHALDVMSGAGAVAAWLSGSGPTVAALVDSADVEAVEAALDSGDLADAGRSMRLAVDHEGIQAAR